MPSNRLPPPPRRSSMVVNSIFNILHTGVKLLFSLVSSMYVARILSVEGVGKVATAHNLVSYFTILAALGIPVYGIRGISRLTGRSQEKDRFFSELLLINAVSTIVCVGLFIAVILQVDLYRQELPLYLCTGLSILFNFINIDWLYKGSEEYRYITMRSVAIKLLSLVMLVLFVRKKEDYILYALLSALGNGLNYLFNVVHARTYVRFTLSGLHPGRHLKPIGFLFLGSFFCTIYSKLDITMLSVISGEEATAYYTYAFRIMEMVLLCCTAISEVFLPRLSYCYQNERESFHKILENGLQMLAFLTFPMATGLALLAPQIVRLLYGESFMPAAQALRFMACLVVIKSIGDLICYQMVICTGNEKRRLPAYALAAVTNVVLNALLIPRLAQNGAVIATVASDLIVNIFVFLSIVKQIKIPFPARSMGISLLAATIMGITVWLIGGLRLPLVGHIVVAVFVGAAEYFAINICFKNPVLQQLLQQAKRLLKR